MAMEHTGMCTRVTCKPDTTTVTEETWRKRVKERGWFVKTKDDEIAAGQALLTVQFLADDDAKAYGRLEGCSGSGKDFVVGVETRAIDAFAQGTATGALVAGDIGKGLKGAADGKLKIASSGGFGKVIAGDKKKLRIAWDTMENVV